MFQTCVLVIVDIRSVVVPQCCAAPTLGQSGVSCGAGDVASLRCFAYLNSVLHLPSCIVRFVTYILNIASLFPT